MRDDMGSAEDEIARWLVDDHDATPSMPKPDRERRRAGLLRVALLGLPWLVVLAVVVIGWSPSAPPSGHARTGPADRPAGAPPAAARPGPTAVVPSQGATADSATTDGAATDGAAASDAVTADVAPTGHRPPATAEATAVALVRDALTRSDDGGATAVEIAVPDGGEQLGEGAWVVRVRAVVLRGDGRRWRTARHEVWAAPVEVRTGEGVALDRPWRVHTGAQPVERPEWRALDGTVAGLDDALRRAGLAPTDVSPQRHASVPHLLRVRARADDRPVDVWLTKAGGLRVLGSARARSAAPTAGPSIEAGATR
jgi:hypothetical protein